jgi:hypothetical protein
VLADALTTAAALLAAAAMLVLSRGLLRSLRRRRAAPPRTPLEIAIAYVRQAARRPVAADRRKALGYLAEILDESGDASRAASTDAIAWSEETPQAERALALADEVESETRDQPA